MSSKDVENAGLLLLAFLLLRRSQPEPVARPPMTVVQVPTPAHLTPSSFETMASVFSDALSAIHGHPPSKEALAMVMAHSGLETGQWHHMYHWNPGFMTRHTQWGYFLMPETDTAHRYGVYDSALSGALDMASLLAQRYPGTVDAMNTGDMSKYLDALKEGHYAEALWKMGPSAEAHYRETATKLFDQFLFKLMDPSAGYPGV